MTKKDFQTIAVSIFHVLSLMLLFVSVSLLLDYRFRGYGTISMSETSVLGFEHSFGLATLILASVSIGVIIRQWIKNNRLELYLGAILISEVILLSGIVILTFIY